MKHSLAAAIPIALIAAASLVTGCGDKTNDDGTAMNDTAATPTTGTETSTSEPTASDPTAAFPGTEAGARALLEEFLKPGADHAGLTRPLQPTTEDYNAIFADQAFASKADVAYGGLWSSEPMVIAPKTGQTELKMWGATTEELKAGSGNAEEFPGGYKEVADKFKDGLTIYRFKFVEPGEDLGMAFDGLTHVNGHWRIVPKPWMLNELPS